jgi:hypothetical protein
MTKRSDPALNALTAAMAAKHARQCTTARTPAALDDLLSSLLVEWPDPVELGTGLEVRYLDEAARETYFGDVDPTN